jgi:hypothetical protein
MPGSKELLLVWRNPKPAGTDTCTRSEIEMIVTQQRRSSSVDAEDEAHSSR